MAKSSNKENQSMQQKRITSFFGKPAVQALPSNTTEQIKVQSSSRKRLKRSIQDDDSDDDDFPTTEPSDTSAVLPHKEPKAQSSPPATTSSSSPTTGISTKPSESSASSSSPKEHIELLYQDLARLFCAIEATSSRLEIQKLLTEFFTQAIESHRDGLLASIYLCVCTNLAPPFEGVQIGLGDSLLIKAIGQVCGQSNQQIKAQYEKEGDLGLVAEKSRNSQQTLSFGLKKKPLSVSSVYQRFLKIAHTKGNKSQDQKINLIKSLLVASTKEEARFLIRGLQGKLRIGLAEKTILISLAYAFGQVQDKANAEKEKEHRVMQLKRAFSECPCYDILIPALCKSFDELTQVGKLRPGIPVSPMLARPCKSYTGVFDRFTTKPFTCEYKYDGERAQIHLVTDAKTQKKTVKIFSRNFEDSTERFPDVVAIVLQAAGKDVVNAIIDTEVVAYDRTRNVRLPFQILSTRGRKNVQLDAIKVQICTYGFDLLYLNDKSYLKESFATRRETLYSSFAISKGEFEFATILNIDNEDSSTEGMEMNVERVRTFLNEAVNEQCEGLMVKTLHTEATYEPANRSHKWLKLKKDYLDGIGDSVDLVPIGAFHGRGKRTGVFGAYLLACYDQETDMYQAITSLGTGLSDEILEKFNKELTPFVRETARSDYAVGTGPNTASPDVWFEPKKVWEILGADLSISPKYTAAIGLVDKSKGISLRFPRFLRERDDKTPAEATDATQIAELYRAQGLPSAEQNGDDSDEDAL